MASGQVTRDHEKIKSWIEERGGSPAAVKGTEGGGGAGVLRVDFPGYSGEQRLEHISWDEFFDTFDKRELGFLYQDKTKEGQTSRFFKFVAASGGQESEEETRRAAGDEEEEEEELIEDEFEEDEEEELLDEDLDEEEEEEEEGRGRGRSKR